MLNNLSIKMNDYSSYSQLVAKQLREMEINKVLREFSDIIR